MRISVTFVRLTLIGSAAFWIAAFGGGGGGASSSFAVGGTVAGLLPGNNVVLQDNGTGNTTVPANGAFAFAARLANAAAFAVTVSGQPAGQTCAIANGSGTVANADVTGVTVTCSGNPFTIGGTVTGLTGTMALQDNGADKLTVGGNGTFTFSAPVLAGATYAVSVVTQPAAERCSVSGGSGTVAAANVTAIAVTCLGKVWTWGGGSSAPGAAGVYGTEGVGAQNNSPGARHGASAWNDLSGGLSMFGGTGNDAAGAQGDLNDLWTYCVCAGARVWTWVSGATSPNAAGVYGTAGVAAAGNTPGTRHGAAAWTDQYGNLWLFGGHGYDSAAAPDVLNDLWKFTPSVGTWAWIGGATHVRAAGVYGSIGASGPGTRPGAREGASAWRDPSGNLWLFGGAGYDAAGTLGSLTDLWVYNTSNDTWIWISGASQANSVGVYGTIGTPSGASVPGSRQGASSWIDSSGALWLSGGLGLDSTGTRGVLNDLWKFSPSAGSWTWVGGVGLADATGAYGTMGQASSGNAPGARQNASSWIDAAVNLWLFGGLGVDSAGSHGDVNDLWKYSPADGNWTWVGGSATAGASGVYGVQGMVSANNMPGARSSATTWTDPDGSFWLIGGNGQSASGAGDLSDMWVYTR